MTRQTFENKSICVECWKFFDHTTCRRPDCLCENIDQGMRMVISSGDICHSSRDKCSQEAG